MIMVRIHWILKHKEIKALTHFNITSMVAPSNSSSISTEDKTELRTLLSHTDQSALNFESFNSNMNYATAD